MEASRITTLFLDIGGVLLTNGWDTALRKKTAEQFGVDYEELDHRHRVTYDTYEQGKMPLETYLRQIIFFEPRNYTTADVTRFVLEQAKPYQDTIDLVRRLKAVYGLRIAVVSNEGREIAEDRIARFRLKEFVDFFIVSAFVHFRKPDLDIYRLALDVADDAMAGADGLALDHLVAARQARQVGVGEALEGHTHLVLQAGADALEVQPVALVLPVFHDQRTVARHGVEAVDVNLAQADRPRLGGRWYGNARKDHRGNQETGFHVLLRYALRP